MTTLILRNGEDERIKRIDLTPVENLISKLESALESKSGKVSLVNRLSMEIIKETESLNKEQMGYLINELIGIVGRNAGLIEYITSNPEKYIQTVRTYNKIARK